MSTRKLIATGITVVASLVLLPAAWAVSPDNPSFEDDDVDPTSWTVLNDGDFPGAGYVVSASGQATDGDNFARLSFDSQCCAYGSSATGPALRSTTVTAGAGEEISVDWRVSALGGYCTGDLGGGDAAEGTGYLVDASDDSIAAIFFEQLDTCGTDWATATVNAPADGSYYLEFRVGSFDETGGGVVGAQMDIDNVQANAPPDCSAAIAVPDMLWPPNHKFHDISVTGVTDPEGDAITITIDAVFQDELTNTNGDGDTCPDAEGIGTDTARVRAERIGGLEGSEGDGRYYWIRYTAEDEFLGSCNSAVRVSVPHDKKTPAVDGGPLFDSTSCP